MEVGRFSCVYASHTRHVRALHSLARQFDEEFDALAVQLGGPISPGGPTGRSPGPSPAPAADTPQTRAERVDAALAAAASLPMRDSRCLSSLW